MSGLMKINFGSDMPVAAIEVFTPDLDLVAQLTSQPFDQHEIEVPSERSFLRVRFPSGRSITLKHDGTLVYNLSKSSFASYSAEAKEASDSPRFSKNLRDLAFYGDNHSAPATSTMGYERLPTASADPATSANHFSTSLPGGISYNLTRLSRVRLSEDGETINLAIEPYSIEPIGLTVVAGGRKLLVKLPGVTESAQIRVSEIGEAERMISIRISTRSASADAVGAFLARGDRFGVEAMVQWAEHAQHLLNTKMQDPYGAALGAYVLLKIERFDLMRDWSKNLANWFPYLSDGCVIWAWQNILQKTDSREIIKEFLLEAADRELPIYTEGLRLLSDGLRHLGKDGAVALDRVSEAAGTVLWTSPFTTRIDGVLDVDEPFTRFDIGYLSEF